RVANKIRSTIRPYSSSSAANVNASLKERASVQNHSARPANPSASAKIPYFRSYDLRSTYATRLSAGAVSDEWVTQMLRQGDAQVFKKYSQMKLQMKREALEKINC